MIVLQQFVKKTEGTVSLYISETFIAVKTFRSIQQRKDIMNLWTSALEGTFARYYFQILHYEITIKKERKKVYSDQLDNLRKRYTPEKPTEQDKKQPKMTHVEKLREEYRKRELGSKVKSTREPKGVKVRAN